jgi:hypothetical protein
MPVWVVLMGLVVRCIRQNAKQEVGMFLRPSTASGDIMCSKVITMKATTRVLSSVFPLAVQDRNSEIVKELQKDFEATLAKKLKDRMAGIPPDDADLGQVEVDYNSRA